LLKPWTQTIVGFPKRILHVAAPVPEGQDTDPIEQEGVEPLQNGANPLGVPEFPPVEEDEDDELEELLLDVEELEEDEIEPEVEELEVQKAVSAKTLEPASQVTVGLPNKDLHCGNPFPLGQDTAPKEQVGEEEPVAQLGAKPLGFPEFPPVEDEGVPEVEPEVELEVQKAVSA
jgi:hypothetical protein